MTMTVHTLRAQYPTAALIISGDRNDLKIDHLLTIDLSLRQIVQENTRGDKILTVILTDLHSLYDKPQIVNPVAVDDAS